MGQFMGLMTDPFMIQDCGGRDGRGASDVTCFERRPSQVLSYAPAEKKKGADAFAALTKAPRATFEQRWRVWGAGFGGSQTTSGNAVTGSNDTRSAIYGMAVGADYVFSPNTLAGFALAGGGTNFSVNGMGSGRSDLFQAGLHLRHTQGAAYVSAALAYGWQNVTTERTALDERLRADFNADAWSGRLEGGYRFAPADTIGVTPYAAAQFTRLYLPTYSEQTVGGGASTFGLDYAGRSVTDTRGELGLSTDTSFAMGNGAMTLRQHFAWAHDFDPDRTATATFQTLPGASFVVNGAARASNSVLIGASAEMVWGNGWSADLGFNGEFSKVTGSYAGKGVLRYQW
jgi:outer membrane autotransporter protein